MAATEAQLLERKAALEELLATGRRSIMFSDRMETYNSVDDIQAAISYINGQIRALTSRPKQTILVASKGL